jgi:hypothetical protein
VLAIKYADLLDEGIAFRKRRPRRAHTQGKRVIIAWSDELHEAVASAKQVRQVSGFSVICHRNGKPYS